MEINYKKFKYSRSEMLDILTIFKVPIDNCDDYIYMKAYYLYKNSHRPVVASTELFLKYWNEREKYINWDNDFKSIETKAEEKLKNSIFNPVEIPIIGGLRGNKIYMENGKTRLIYLLRHHAKSLPLMCPNKNYNTIKYLISPIILDDHEWIIF